MPIKFAADKVAFLRPPPPPRRKKHCYFLLKKVSNNWKRNQNLLQDPLVMSHTVKKQSTLLQSLFSPVRNVVLFLNLHNLYQLVDWVQSWHLLWTDIVDTHIHQWDLPHFVKCQHSAHDTSSDIGRSQCKICKIQKSVSDLIYLI